MYQARTLTPQQQFDLVLPQQGRRVLFRASTKAHYFFSNNEELSAAVESWRDQEGVYMGTCGYGPLDERTQDNAQWVKSLYIDIDAGPEKFAKHGAKVYETVQDALVALVAFCKEIGLTPGAIMSSGMGLHVYWVLDRDYTTAEARPVMRRLKQACKDLGLKADPAVTADTARVLRPVGGLHSTGENGSKRRVECLKLTGKTYTLDDTQQALMRFIPQDEDVKKGDFNLNDDILKSYPEIDASLRKGADNCAALAEVRDAGGAVQEPFWRLMIGVAKHCTVDGREAAHEFSSGDARYDPRTLDNYFDRWDTGPSKCATFSEHTDACRSCPHNGKITSPIMLCRVDAVTRAAEQRPEEAEAAEPCAEAADAAEPSDLEKVLTFQQRRKDLFTKPSEAGFYFAEYGKGADKTWRLYTRVLVDVPDPADPTGKGTVKAWESMHIADRLFWLESCADFEGTAHIELVVVKSPSNPQLAPRHLSAAVLADNNAFSKAMFTAGVIIDSGPQAAQAVRKFITQEYRRVQNLMRFSVKKHYGFDWHEGEFLCAHGEVVVHSDGSMERVTVNPKIRAFGDSYLRLGCLPKSEEGTWGPEAIEEHVMPAARRYFEFVHRYYKGPEFRPHRFALAMGLASPYLVFSESKGWDDGTDIPAAGGVVSLYGETGKGKTAVQKLIAAAFGMGGKTVGGDTGTGATTKSRSTFASILGFYPLLLDEVSQNDAAKQAQEVQMLANGMPRERLTSAGELSTSGNNWNLISIMSTNTPQSELVASAERNSTALLARILEISFNDTPNQGDAAHFSEYDREVDRVLREGGAVGLMLSYLAVRAGRDWMADQGNKIVDGICKKFNLEREYRFYGRMAAAMLLANEMLRSAGLPAFDKRELLQDFLACTTKLTHMLRVNRRTPEELFAKMVNDLARSIVVTKEMASPGRQVASPILNQSNLTLPLVGRQVNEEKRLYLTQAAVQKWLTDNRVPSDAFLMNLRAAGRVAATSGGEIVTRRSLSSGIIGMPELPRVRCYAFNLTGGTDLLLTNPQPIEEEAAYREIKLA